VLSEAIWRGTVQDFMRALAILIPNDEVRRALHDERHFELGKPGVSERAGIPEKSEAPMLGHGGGHMLTGGPGCSGDNSPGLGPTVGRFGCRVAT